MSLLLDTNVVSDLLRPSPTPTLESWVAERPFAELYFLAVGQVAIRYGLAMLPAAQRKDTPAAAGAVSKRRSNGGCSAGQDPDR